MFVKPGEGEQPNSQLLGLLKSLLNKPVKFKNSLDQRQISVIKYWAEAFNFLREHPQLWGLFQRMCKGVILGLPERTEDAQWRPDKWMFLATRDSGHNPRHMYKGVVHELGHAFEEELGIEVDIDNSVYGKPPFCDNYAFTNSTEDFAETFMMIWLNPELLKQVAIQKYEDMSERVSVL